MGRMVELFATFIARSQTTTGATARPRFTSDLDTPTYSPLVTAQCNLYDYALAVKSLPGAADYPSFPFPNTVMFNSTSIHTAADALPVPQDLWNFTRCSISSLQNGNFIWVDTWILGNENSSRTSLGRVWTLPYMLFASDGTFAQQSFIVPCSVDARWVSSYVQDDIGSDTLTLNITDTSVFQYATKYQYGITSDIVQIDLFWAAQLNSWTFGATDGSFQNLMNMSAMEALTRAFVGIQTQQNDYLSFLTNACEGDFADYGYNAAQFLSLGIGAVLADGLARMQLDRNITLVSGPDTTTENAQVDITGLVHQEGSLFFQYTAPLSNWMQQTNFPPSEWFRYSITVERYGYGWGLTNPISILAMAVLALHMLIVCTYPVYIFLYSPTTWTDSMGFLPLALNSSPNKELDGTCAGVESPEVLRHRVAIREFPADSYHLELVFASGSDMSFPGAPPVPTSSTVR